MKKQQRVRVLLVGEFQVRGPDPLAGALAELDAFREAVQPAAEYGLTLYQATAEDLAAFGGALSVVGPPRGRDRTRRNAR